MTEEELVELEAILSEPAGGHNHGRKRSEAGGWTALETDPQDIPSFKEYADPKKHGIAQRYNEGCRCDLCKAWRRGKAKRDRGNV